MSEKKTSWKSTPRTDFTGWGPAGKEMRRRDWGFTDQYRRMMQKETRNKVSQ